MAERKDRGWISLGEALGNVIEELARKFNGATSGHMTQPLPSAHTHPMRRLTFSDRQLEVAEQALTAYVEQIQTQLREGTYSEILADRRTLALSVLALLRSEPR